MIYLHLGAHKTATTYIQDLLELNRGPIWGGGRALAAPHHPAQIASLGG